MLCFGIDKMLPTCACYDNLITILCSRDEGKLRACWNIREVACPHSAAREETRIWNDVLDIVCWKKTKRPGKGLTLVLCI